MQLRFFVEKREAMHWYPESLFSIERHTHFNWWKLDTIAEWVTLFFYVPSSYIEICLNWSRQLESSHFSEERNKITRTEVISKTVRKKEIKTMRKRCIDTKALINSFFPPLSIRSFFSHSSPSIISRWINQASDITKTIDYNLPK